MHGEEFDAAMLIPNILEALFARFEYSVREDEQDGAPEADLTSAKISFAGNHLWLRSVYVKLAGFMLRCRLVYEL